MNTINRRKFLLLAGASSAAATVGGALPAAGLMAGKSERIYAFRAVTGVPEKPLPAYASYVIEGHIDLAAGSGVMTKMVFAGAPENMSAVALPGMSQTVRITGVREQGSVLHLNGVVSDRSQLAKGESQHVTLQIDRAARTMQGHLFGQAIALRLQ